MEPAVPNFRSSVFTWRYRSMVSAGFSKKSGGIQSADLKPRRKDAKVREGLVGISLDSRGSKFVQILDGFLQVLGRQVGVAHAHFGVFVAQQLLNGAQLVSAHGQPGREVMPQIVQPEILDPGAVNGPSESGSGVGG